MRPHGQGLGPTHQPGRRWKLRRCGSGIAGAAKHLPVDTELNRAEAELLHEETSLHNEMGRLLGVGMELIKKIKGLTFAAAEAAAKGVCDPDLDERLAKAVVPIFDTEEPFSESRAARQAAVIARRASTKAVRDLVASLKHQLNTLSSQVQADEKLVRKLSSLAKRARGGEAAEPARVAVPQNPTPVPMGSPPPKRVLDPSIPERQSPRVKMQAAIDLHSDNNFFVGFSANISDGGIFVATVNLLPIGTQVELSFSLPSGERISAHGVVRWVREVNDQHPDAFPGLGIQFMGLDVPAVEAISSFVAAREPLFYVE